MTFCYRGQFDIKRAHPYRVEWRSRPTAEWQTLEMPPDWGEVDYRWGPGSDKHDRHRLAGPLLYHHAIGHWDWPTPLADYVTSRGTHLTATAMIQNLPPKWHLTSRDLDLFFACRLAAWMPRDILVEGNLHGQNYQDVLPIFSEVDLLRSMELRMGSPLPRGVAIEWSPVAVCGVIRHGTEPLGGFKVMNPLAV